MDYFELMVADTMGFSRYRWGGGIFTINHVGGGAYIFLVKAKQGGKRLLKTPPA